MEYSDLDLHYDLWKGQKEQGQEGGIYAKPYNMSLICALSNSW